MNINTATLLFQPLKQQRTRVWSRWGSFRRFSAAQSRGGPVGEAEAPVSANPPRSPLTTTVGAPPCPTTVFSRAPTPSSGWAPCWQTIATTVPVAVVTLTILPPQWTKSQRGLPEWRRLPRKCLPHYNHSHRAMFLLVQCQHHYHGFDIAHFLADC